MNRPAFKEAIKFWIKLGFISFGGPAGQIAIMHEFLVEKKKWISDSKFLHALNYCMILPGPEAQQLATYIGWMLHGIRGGLAAGIFFVLPSMLVLFALSVLYVSFGNIPWIYAMFSGLKPAVIAIVILALVKISKKSLQSTFHFIIAIIAFICIYFLEIPFPLIIVGSIITAIIVRKYFSNILSKGHSHKSGWGDKDESIYYINRFTVVENAGFNLHRFWRPISLGLLLWTIPMIAFYYFTSDFVFWKELSLFFTQAAFVTFGGAYAVLPYVAQVSVEKFNWLTSAQMIDGLALGETTPGPLIMVLVYVGFMAGYNHFGSSLVMGTVGLLTTTFYTFLPCFLFIFTGAPIIERTHDNEKIKEMLSVVTAAVVGVILNLTLYFSKAVMFPSVVSFSGLDYVSLSWTVVSFMAMYRFRIGMIAWIGISALFGIISYWMTQV